MNNSLSGSDNVIKGLSKNPLSIISLFIVLVYGFACLLFSSLSKNLGEYQTWVLISFIVIFPFIVLRVFYILVTKHNDKLYSPKDYRTDESYLKLIEQSSGIHRPEESENNIKDLLNYAKEFSIISTQEENIEKDLKQRKLDTSSPIAKVLIHQLAACQILSWFEKCYFVLFGSQITLLRSLKNKSHAVDEVQLYFKKVQERYSILCSWTLETYLQFMIDSKLINIQDDLISITEAGKEFLTWLSKSSYLQEKSF